MHEVECSNTKVAFFRLDLGALHENIAATASRGEHDAARVKVEHILLSFGGTGTKATRSKAEAQALTAQVLARVEAGEDMTFDFGTLIAHAAKTRALGAGTIVGSGTVSNRDADGGPGRPVADGGVGYCCLAEVRTVETIRTGTASTPFLKKGDTVRIWAEDDRHHPIFGTIEQTVA